MNKRLITSAVLVFTMLGSISAQYQMSEGTRKLATTLTLIEKMYVDKISDTKLADDAIVSLLQKLDPHSSYISKEEVAEMNEPLEGNFDGIGIAFNMMNDTLYVIETIAGGPSEKVGLLPGDRIIAVNDSTIAGVKMSTKNIMKRLKGQKGTKVDVRVIRKSVFEPINFNIIRGKIPVFSLDAAYMIDNQSGYIRLSRFGATTTQEFKQALAKLQKAGLKNLILDLEYNGGGYMGAASDLANEFLGKDKLLVYMEGEHLPRNTTVSKTGGMFEVGKLVVLVDDASASASEIVAGAIQDWDRGVIVGRRTFGKGLVQRPFPLPDGSQIRLTVARYYTPTGRSIQKPYTSGDADSYNREFIERYNRGEMMSADSIHFPDSLKYKTLVNERTVYGGGGIMPDYFVPMDTTEYTQYMGKVSAMGIIARLSLEIVDNQRKDLLKRYPTVDQYRKKYEVSDEVLNRMVEMAEKDKIKYNEEQFLRSKASFQQRLKSLIARDLYNTEAYYQIVNDDNDIFLKGLEVINDDKMYHKLLEQQQNKALHYENKH